MAIYLTFNQWIDKRMILANWGCGIDLTLHTISIPRQFIHIKNKIIEDHVEIYASPKILTLNDDNTHGEPMGNILTGVHGQDEPYEMVIHLPHKLRHSNEHETYQEQLFDYNDDEGIHARDEPSNETEIIFDDDIKQNTTVNQRQQN
ncbi:unnamed protein product [Rotaria sordida]|uniref:Uncharacterized protein n=1 Tax=Rotaria sordida TaxID=392033 RepID=A0A814VI25_9BILA|nr:unnamed protein product [Rotaria sordida]CAF1077741.1 unnamed protein product [Rotaria sordida]CAF1189285.1 unnamed protein product [Rotaria sordida]CAF1234787.1 unnamed protein product [Rotaria sordida]CAF1239512.1 unnamed protein product [Rotaria sordida]